MATNDGDEGGICEHPLPNDIGSLLFPLSVGWKRKVLNRHSVVCGESPGWDDYEGDFGGAPYNPTDKDIELRLGRASDEEGVHMAIAGINVQGGGYSNRLTWEGGGDNFLDVVCLGSGVGLRAIAEDVCDGGGSIVLLPVLR